MWMLPVLLFVTAVGCGLGGGRPTDVRSPVYEPPTWRERQLALRQTWDRLIAERTARETQVVQDQQVEARDDALRQLPYVSLAAGGQTTLAEAVSLLLTGTPYSVVYGPYVEPSVQLASYIAHQRLDRALATLVHPLGYRVTMDPLDRQVQIDAMLTRQWSLPGLPATDQRLWTTLEADLKRLVHGESSESASPGFVSLNPSGGEVTVSARVPRMPLVETHMRHVAAMVAHEEPQP
jgi:hypothetical protein